MHEVPTSRALDVDQVRCYRQTGHLTVPGVLDEEEVEHALADVERWGREFTAGLDADGRAWYLEAGRDVLRKLDNPHAMRDVFAALAAKPRLVAIVEDLIGPGVSVYFSQIFLKPPGGGGPKPVHQDNFYFGPSDPEGMVTAWVALDDATPENGCLFYGEGSNAGPVHPHVAPPGRPYDLQVPESIAARQPMTPAPVPRGGVSLHHGNTFHQSGHNHSPRWRRACAFHYVRNGNRFTTPALDYDHSLIRRVS